MAVHRQGSRAGGTTGGASFEVRGADQLAALARVLRYLGDKELRSELYRGINRITKPAKADVKASALATFPKRGGLAARMAKTKIRTRRRVGQRTAGISLIATDSYEIRRMDQGRLRHPVYGNRKAWVTQNIQPGWWTRPLEAQAPRMRKELVDLIEDIAEQVKRKVE